VRSGGDRRPNVTVSRPAGSRLKRDSRLAPRARANCGCSPSSGGMIVLIRAESPSDYTAARTPLFAAPSRAQLNPAPAGSAARGVGLPGQSLPDFVITIPVFCYHDQGLNLQTPFRNI
jgi:hypothetical protein